MSESNLNSNEDRKLLYDSIDRRDYLKSAAATAGVIAGFSGTASAGDCNYDVIEANNENIYVNGGETFENKIIDFTNGNWATIVARGANWTIRNVGFRGTHDHDHSAMSIADDQGGSSLVEHIYLGDGCIRPDSYSSHGQVGIFVHRDHEGHVDIRDVNVQDWPNNGIYASAAAYDTPGSVTIDHCFGANNYVSTHRVSDYGEVLDSRAYNDSNGRFDGRPFWGWGDQDVVGCELDGGTYSDGDAVYGYDDSHTYLEDTTHTGYEMASGATYEEGPGVEVVGVGEPDRSIQCGIPTTPKEAACGHDPCGDGGGRDEDVAPIVVDDFERSSPLDEYGGATSLYSVESSTIYEGSQAIVNDGGNFGSVASTSGLSGYPDRGDEVHVHFNNAADDNFVATHFFAQSETDNPDSYSVGISGQGAWRMWRHENGDVTQIASQDLPTSDQIDGWYRAEVRPADTTIYADLYDDSTDELLASIQADDTTYASGGIGFRSAGNGEVWDYAIREVVDDFERSSPLDDYGGATSLYTTTTSPVYEGGQAIVNDGGNFGSVASTSGLSGYPDRGEEVHVHFNNAADDNFVATHFFAQAEEDNPDSYSVGISGQGAWRMWRHENGDVTQIASQDLPTSDQIDGWYRAEVWSDSTSVYADLYDDANDTLLASIQADDTTYASGGIGFRSAGNGEVWDYVTR